MLSQVSRVSAVRTMRALLRAVSIADIALDGLDRFTQQEVGDIGCAVIVLVFLAEGLVAHRR